MAKNCPCSAMMVHLLLLATTTVDLCLGGAISHASSVKAEPMFISQSAAFKFVVGDTISLPCEVTHPGTYVLAWKRGIAILTAGTVKVTPDPRVRLVNGYTLQIKEAVPQDAGDYICQIATLDPREITHHVEILIPPKIHHVTSGGHLQVKKGSPVRLECSATGNPTPNITWTRKNNVLPNGEEKYVSPAYIIENMDRHKGGIYICTASNGVGHSASSQINLHVLWGDQSSFVRAPTERPFRATKEMWGDGDRKNPPEISVERQVVFSGEGQEAALVCIVHGEAQPEVMWFKDTMQIDQTDRMITEARGARHTLIIRKVHAMDFGNFSCVADNQLGKSRKTVTLTGRPNVATFRSAPNSQWRDKYNVSWTVDSFTPIEEYKLYYRPIFSAQEQSHQVYAPKPRSPFNADPPPSPAYDTFNYHAGYGNAIHWGKNEWRDIVLPAIPLSPHYTQGMSYVIRNLDPDQQYEAKVQSRNRFGWSDFTERFLFTTSNTDTEMRDMSVTHYSSPTSGTESFFRWRLATTALTFGLLSWSF